MSLCKHILNAKKCILKYRFIGIQSIKILAMQQDKRELINQKEEDRKDETKEEKEKIEEKIDEELEQSFPASDPPSYSQPGNDDILRTD
jgi:hypothetical protein